MIITTYNPDGTVLETREIEGSVEQTDELRQIPRSSLDKLSDKLNDPAVNSISKVKDALKEFIGSIE